MPLRRRRHLSSPVEIAEQRIAVPLARLEERLVTVSSSLDTLVAGLGDVAHQIRQMAQQAAERTADIDE